MKASTPGSGVWSRSGGGHLPRTETTCLSLFGNGCFLSPTTRSLRALLSSSTILLGPQRTLTSSLMFDAYMVGLALRLCYVFLDSLLSYERPLLLRCWFSVFDFGRRGYVLVLLLFNRLFCTLSIESIVSCFFVKQLLTSVLAFPPYVPPMVFLNRLSLPHEDLYEHSLGRQKWLACDEYCSTRIWPCCDSFALCGDQSEDLGQEKNGSSPST